MKYAADSFFPKVSNQPGSYLYITHLDIIHMGIVAAFLRHIRLFDLTFLCKMSQIFMIIIVYLHSFGKDLISCFQLCIKICCIQFTWKIGRTIIHPAILVNLSAEKLTSVSSLFSQDLCFLHIFIPVKKDCTALSHSIVLCLMETVTPKISNGTKSFSLITGIYSLRSVFNNLQIVFLCNLHNGIHLTGNPCIVDRDDHFCFLSHCRLDQFLINIHCIRSDINKYNLCSL